MSDMAERLNAALGGRYAIERELGEGGMATVYVADDLKPECKQLRLQHHLKRHTDRSPKQRLALFRPTHQPGSLR
jgi:hypothetical protein